MKCQVTEIAPGTYRISAFNPDYGLQFNQFLIADDEPFLMHTGFRSAFPAIRDAVASVLDPKTLRWIGFSHFESDECGSLNDWLALAPKAQAACSFVGVTVNLIDYAIRPARALADGEVLPTGKRRLRFLATPHVPHGWDAGLFFEETEQTLLCSDLFFQPGDTEPINSSGIVARTREAIEGNAAGPLAKDLPYTSYTDATLRRLADLAPKTIAAMHGSTYRGDGRTAITEFAAMLPKAIGER